MTIFDFIKSKCSILDVVLEYVQMRRLGGYWKGSCPFHQEADASFTVSPDKQIFYCFGCHAGGDVIAFVAKAENLSPYEAVCHLIEKHQIQVPPEIKRDMSQLGGSQKEQFFTTCESIAKFGYEQLLAHKPVQEYLEKRKLGPDEWKKFMIGYFPSGTAALNRFIKDMARKNVLVKDLESTGFVLEGRGMLYSPFEERILFPIKDVLGRFCGFGGRIFGLHDERAKYYNSRESDWFSKGKLLFGFDLAKKDMQTSGKAFLVEGYIDCIAMVQHGYKNTVATLGTACTADHLKTLSRYIKMLYVVYDGDAAGQKAILRLTKLCWETNLDLQIIKLPTKEDPASFLLQGGNMDALIEQSCDIFAFFVNSRGEQFWGKSLSEKMTLCDDIVQLVAKIDDQFKQDLLLQQAARVMQVPFESLKILMAQYQKSRDASRVDNEDFGSVTTTPKTSLAEANDFIEEKIAALVANSVLTEKPFVVDKALLPYFSPHIRLILEQIEIFVQESEVKNFDALLKNFKNEQSRNLIMRQSFLEEGEDQAQLFESLVFRFCRQNWKRIVQDVKQQIFQAKKECDKEKLQHVLNLFSSLKQEMKERGIV